MEQRTPERISPNKHPLIFNHLVFMLDNGNPQEKEEIIKEQQFIVSEILRAGGSVVGCLLKEEHEDITHILWENGRTDLWEYLEEGYIVVDPHYIHMCRNNNKLLSPKEFFPSPQDLFMRTPKDIRKEELHYMDEEEYEYLLKVGRSPIYPFRGIRREDLWAYVNERSFLDIAMEHNKCKLQPPDITLGECVNITRKQIRSQGNRIGISQQSAATVNSTQNSLNWFDCLLDP